MAFDFIGMAAMPPMPFMTTTHKMTATHKKGFVTTVLLGLIILLVLTSVTGISLNKNVTITAIVVYIAYLMHSKKI